MRDGDRGPCPRPRGGILVVDDDLAVLRLLVALLDRHGLAARPVADPARALDAALLDPPELVLLDVDLGGASGFDLAHELKSAPALASVPIVFMSGHEGPDHRVRAFAAGGADFLQKPLYEAEVVARIRAHLQAAELQALLRDQNADLEARLAEQLAVVHQTREHLLARADALLALHAAADDEGPALVERALASALALTQSRAVLYAAAFRNRRELQVDVAGVVDPAGAPRFVRRRATLGGAAVREALWHSEAVLAQDPASVGHLGEAVEALVGPASRACVVPLLEQGVASSLVAVLDRAEPYTEDHISMLRVLGETLRQILRRKAAEESLRGTLDHLQKLALAVEHSPASVVIADREGRIEYVNRKFSEVTGYSLDEAVGQNPRLLKSGETSPDDYRRLWDILTSGHTWTGQFRNVRKDGTSFWEHASISPVRRGPDQPITHFVAVKEDISAQRELETQLRHAQKLEAIGQLAAGIAHEINTPSQYLSDNLAFIQRAWDRTQGALDSVKALVPGSEALLERVPKALVRAREGLERIRAIVTAMGDFAHPGSGAPAPTDLRQLVGSAVELTRHSWKYVAEVHVDIAEGADEVCCVAGEVGQALINLLVNAAHAIEARYGREGGVRGRIVVETRAVGGLGADEAVEIAIHDDGAGIPEAAQPRVFEPFFTTKPHGQGSGQGLAIVYHIVVRRHGGHIGFTTRPGEGTTFRLRLPREPCGRAGEQPPPR